MKKIYFLIFLIFLSINLMGCAALKEKFVRKSKKTSKTKEIFQRTDVVYPKDIRYSNHFVYWKSWEGELIANIGKNNKKVLGCADRALYNLTQLQELLKSKKQREMKRYVDELSEIVEEFHRGGVSIPRQRKIIDILNRHMWDVQKNFDYPDMKEGQWIQED